jgi:hypothetical protein
MIIVKKLLIPLRKFVLMIKTLTKALKIICHLKMMFMSMRLNTDYLLFSKKLGRLIAKIIFKIEKLE